METVKFKLDRILKINFKNLNSFYSDNQKTMEQKDDIISILKRFDVGTKQIFLLVTQQSTI